MLRGALGLEMIDGTPSAQYGTRNALVRTGPSQYLEALTCLDPAETTGAFSAAIAQYEEPHLWAYVLRCENGNAAHDYAELYGALGVDMMGPNPLSRKTHTGETLNWDMYAPIGPHAHNLMPLGLHWKGAMAQDLLPHTSATVTVNIRADEALATSLIKGGLADIVTVAPGNEGISLTIEKDGRSLEFEAQKGHLPMQGAPTQDGAPVSQKA